jgi:membrane protein
VAGSAAFSVYVAKFGNYDKTFGSLGAVVVLLTWLYLSAYVVLLGACFNAEMERQTARDTTIGPEKPMGQRGAKMADTVADDNRAQPSQT